MKYERNLCRVLATDSLSSSREKRKRFVIDPEAGEKEEVLRAATVPRIFRVVVRGIKASGEVAFMQYKENKLKIYSRRDACVCFFKVGAHDVENNSLREDSEYLKKRGVCVGG